MDDFGLVVQAALLASGTHRTAQLQRQADVRAAFTFASDPVSRRTSSSISSASVSASSSSDAALRHEQRKAPLQRAYKAPRAAALEAPSQPSKGDASDFSGRRGRPFVTAPSPYSSDSATLRRREVKPLPSLRRTQPQSISSTSPAIAQFTPISCGKGWASDGSPSRPVREGRSVGRSSSVGKGRSLSSVPASVGEERRPLGEALLPPQKMSHKAEPSRSVGRRRCNSGGTERPVVRSAPLPNIAADHSRTGGQKRVPREAPGLAGSEPRGRGSESEAEAGRSPLALTMTWKPPAPPRLHVPPPPEPKRRYLQLGHRQPQPFSPDVCPSPPPGTPEPEAYDVLQYPSMQDVTAQRRVAQLLEGILKVERKRERAEAAAERRVDVLTQHKERTQTRQRAMKEQRAVIYMLNAAMAEHEQATFNVFKARMEKGDEQLLYLSATEDSDSDL